MGKPEYRDSPVQEDVSGVAFYIDCFPVLILQQGRLASRSCEDYTNGFSIAPNLCKEDSVSGASELRTSHTYPSTGFMTTKDVPLTTIRPTIRLCSGFRGSIVSGSVMVAKERKQRGRRLCQYDKDDGHSC